MSRSAEPLSADEVAPREGDGARGGLDQPNDAAPERGLAAAALADEAERLAVLDVERDAVERLDVLARAPEQPRPDREMFLEVSDFEERHLTRP